MNNRTTDVFRFLGIPTTMKATAATTNGAFGLMEHLSMPPGFASPYHMHHQEDESFYVLEGELAFVIDGKWHTAAPGTFLYGPREIPHGFKVIGGKPASILLMCTPGGFEQFVLDLSNPDGMPDMAKLVAIAASYRIDILGPLPAQE